MKWILEQKGINWDELSNLYKMAPLGDKKPDDLKVVFSNSMQETRFQNHAHGDGHFPESGAGSEGWFGRWSMTAARSGPVDARLLDSRGRKQAARQSGRRIMCMTDHLKIENVPVARKGRITT